MKHLYKLAFILVLGMGLALAQTTPSTSQPSGAQAPDKSQMGQKGAGLGSAQSDIQAALHKQLPNVADNVTVSSTDDNKIQLAGTVSSDAEKQQVEQIARTAAPNADIVNKLTVSGSATSPSTQPPSGSKPPQLRLIAYQSAGQASTPSPAPQTAPSTPPANDQTGSMSQSGGGDVQDKIQKAIQQDSSLSGANVNVAVNNNQVELTGTVASKEQKKTVKQIAETNAGGMKVVDHLKVEGKGTSPSTPPETPKI
ncbi:MAG TPA: BON domain-containing protein [Candidatus Angelobacter sp.]